MSTPPYGTMTGPKITAEEMVESLTGFEELAIEKNFGGFDIYTDGEAKGIRAMRALAFVHHRRDGMSDREALKEAQEKSFRQVMDMFITSEPEVDADAPETDSGKDSALPA